MPSDELETTWTAIREELRRSATDLTFHLWLEPLCLAGRERDLLYVRAPRHIRTLVEERYLPLLRTAAERALSTRVAVSVVGDEWAGPAGAGGAERGTGGEAEPDRAGGVATALNPRHTFAEFVIGDDNRLGHAAALAVAEQPAQAYNPLFLYGPPGLGKTHLLHAIGNYVRRYGGLTVRYTTSDDFTSAFVQAVRRDGIDTFKAAFRGVDVLLLDDVQFLAERARTQEEFFHTFNALYDAGRQLVVSSDRPPGEMNAFERRLVERFASGLVAELQAPQIDVRVAILRKRAALDGIADIDDDTLRAVAAHASPSVRSLEGALIRVVAHSSLHDKPPSPELACEALAPLYGHEGPHSCTVGEIQRVAADAFGLSQKTLLAHDRRPHIVLARQVAMYLARELTDDSLPAIGAAFDGRNHSTILHAHRKIATEITRNRSTAERIDALRLELTGTNPTAVDATIHSRSTAG